MKIEKIIESLENERWMLAHHRFTDDERKTVIRYLKSLSKEGYEKLTR